LLEVGLVHVRRDGRRMLYRTNAEADHLLLMFLTVGPLFIGTNIGRE
jgi:DNA-binding transcriptional ArsR family regulator